MHRFGITAFAIALTFWSVEFTLVSKAQNENSVKLKDPGFESFKLARVPIFGRYSEDIPQL
jgi:hypothetical protein